MNKPLLLAMSALAISILAGCAEMTQKTYAPNGANSAGTIRYSTDWYMGQKNRAKAVEQMKEYCAPNKSRLLAEDMHAEFSGQSSSDTSYSKHSAYTTTTEGKSHYTYLHFKCVKTRS